MANKTLKFWNSIKDYNLEITSVFLEENKLSEVIKNIKNKDKKIIGDFGCGIGNAIPYIIEFKEIFAVDFSENMLSQTKNKYKKFKNIIFLKENLNKIILNKKLDILLSIMSIFPLKYYEFDEIIENYIKNLKKNGKMILVLPSLESLNFFYQIDSLNQLKLGIPETKIKKNIENITNKYQINPLGYVINNGGITQKQWLKEEILFRLEKYNFKKIDIEKLELNWETQLKKKEYKKFPKFWYWLIEINI